MTATLSRLRSDWDAILAFSLAWIAIAVNLGPAYYFLLLFVVCCAYVIRVALKR